MAKTAKAPKAPKAPKVRTVADVKAAASAARLATMTANAQADVDAGTADDSQRGFLGQLDAANGNVKAGRTSRERIGEHYPITMAIATPEKVEYQGALGIVTCDATGATYTQTRLVTERIAKHHANGRGACLICGNKLGSDVSEGDRITGNCRETFPRWVREEIIFNVKDQLADSTKAVADLNSLADKVSNSPK